MKAQPHNENLKTKLSSTYVRIGLTAAVVLPAAFLGGVNLSNHNETLIRV